MQYHHLIIAICHLYVIKVRNERLMTIFNQRFPRDRLKLLLYDSFLKFLQIPDQKKIRF